MIVIMAMFGALVACGGSDAAPETARCWITPSALGLFSPDALLGQSMNEDEARARMAQDDIVGWLAVHAEGPWDESWGVATAALGQGIHVDLTWLDVNGTINNLYTSDDEFVFDDLRVSRSFQGKIEHSDDPLYLPLQDVGAAANDAASCTITALEVGNAANDQLLDVFDATSSSS